MFNKRIPFTGYSSHVISPKSISTFAQISDRPCVLFLCLQAKVVSWIVSGKWDLSRFMPDTRQKGWTQMQTPKAEQVQFNDLLISGKLTGHKADEGQNQKSVKLGQTNFKMGRGKKSKTQVKTLKIARWPGKERRWTYQEGKVKTQVKHTRVMTTGGKRTKGETVKQDQMQEEKTYKIKQTIMKQ